MTPQEFSAKIKEKNPSLQSVDDVELARKIVAKYPEYSNDVNFGNEKPKPLPIKDSVIPVAPDKEGFFSSIKNALLGRASSIKDTFNQALSGNLDPLSTGLQTTGAIAGGINDVIGAGINKVTPQSVKNAIGTGVNAVMSTDIAKSAEQAYNNFKTNHPTASKDLESAFNIAMLLPAYKGAGVVGGATEKVGQGLINSGEKGLVSNTEKFSSKLVRPTETAKTALADVPRTTETGFGPFKKSIIEPTKAEKMAGEAVKNVPGISPSKTYQQNYNIISKYNSNLAQQLENDVKNTPFIISKKEIVSNLNKAAKSLSESPLIVGDAEKMANRLIEGAKKIVNENKGTGEGLFKARKEFDSWIKSQKPKAFDATADNAFTIANRAVRNTFNELLEAKAPTLDLKNRLLNQHALYNALDVIAPKAAVEANTAIGRGLQNVGKVIGVKNQAVQAGAAIAGIGGLGAAATFAPPIAAIGIPSYLLYKGGKAILSPQSRLLSGKIIKGASKLLPR